MVALPREAPDARSVIGRASRTGLIVQHPTTDSRTVTHGGAREHGQPPNIAALENRLRDEARLEGVHLAAREIAHLVNNDLAVAVCFVDLLQQRAELPTDLRDMLEGAAARLEAAARHLQQLQGVVRVVVKETAAGQSLDLERSQSHQS